MGVVFDEGIATLLDTMLEMAEYVLTRMGTVGRRGVALPMEPYPRLRRAVQI